MAITAVAVILTHSSEKTRRFTLVYGPASLRLSAVNFSTAAANMLGCMGMFWFTAMPSEGAKSLTQLAHGHTSAQHGCLDLGSHMRALLSVERDPRHGDDSTDAKAHPMFAFCTTQTSFCCIVTMFRTIGASPPDLALVKRQLSGR